MKTNTVTLRLDNETKYLLEQAGIVHVVTGRKIKSKGNFSDFVRDCIKAAFLSNKGELLQPAEVKRRYWNFKRRMAEEDQRLQSELLSAQIVMCAQNERKYQELSEYQYVE